MTTHSIQTSPIASWQRSRVKSSLNRSRFISRPTSKLPANLGLFRESSRTPPSFFFPSAVVESPAAPLSLIPAFCRADYDLSAEDQRSVGVGDRDGPEALFPPKNTGDAREAVLILSAESTR